MFFAVMRLRVCLLTEIKHYKSAFRIIRIRIKIGDTLMTSYTHIPNLIEIRQPIFEILSGNEKPSTKYKYVTTGRLRSS